jgi:glycosyltransferase involved in cell wall biosynthesis
LGQALERLLSDQPLCARLGENARRLAQDRFSLPALGRALRQFYTGMKGGQNLA